MWTHKTARRGFLFVLSVLGAVWTLITNTHDVRSYSGVKCDACQSSVFPPGHSVFCFLVLLSSLPRTQPSGKVSPGRAMGAGRRQWAPWVAGRMWWAGDVVG